MWSRRLLLLFPMTVVTAEVARGLALSAQASEEESVEAVASPDLDLGRLEPDDVEHLVRRGWHDVIRALVSRGHRSDNERDAQHVATMVRQAVQAERNRLDDLLRALDRNYGRAVDVSPAMQWAQNSTHVFLAVKFAQRWNAPGALEVENETVDISLCCVNFTAFGEHSFIRRRYHFSLQLLRPTLPKLSVWSLASVGRLSMTIAKAAPENWPRLVLDVSAAPRNLGIWRDMREKWKGDLERLPIANIDANGMAGGKPDGRTHVEPFHETAKKINAGKNKKKKKLESKLEDGGAEDEDALDREVELLSDCEVSSYAGTSVAELCKKAWGDVVEKPVVRGRRWLIEFYSSDGSGNLEAMKDLIPVWRRLADLFPSAARGGRVGAVDCGRDKALCRELGVSPPERLPEIRRVAAGGGSGDVWRGPLTAPIEALSAFGDGGRDEL